jgi:ABC-2 type transport system ATP-binding protein
MSETVLSTQDLTVYYGRQRGILGVGLDVQAGEVFGFLGPNGAGKTTTLRVLLDLLRPARGTARIFDLDCHKDGVEIRKRTGYLPGELSLYDNMTANEFLSLTGHIRGVNGELSYRGQLCERLDLDPTRKMREYSRGNKQKVGVVAAFMNHPEMLILDEPTTGLDPLVQQTVLNLVREARAEGRTVFFSSHVLPEVQAVCDRVGIIRDGQLIATERISDLTQQQFRRVRLSFAAAPAPETLLMPGVELIDQHANSLSFEVRENLNQLIQLATTYNVVDIETLPVTLEEVFLAYYGSAENGGRHV